VLFTQFIFINISNETFKGDDFVWAYMGVLLLTLQFRDKNYGSSGDRDCTRCQETKLKSKQTGINCFRVADQISKWPYYSTY
jgi:hypothetical protein